MRIFLASSWLLVLIIAMLTPGTKFPEVDLFNFQDKAVHLICFGIQAYLWTGVGIKKDQISTQNPQVWTNFLLFGIVAGIVLESLQYFIPFRTFDLMDMFVNALGALLGLIGYLKWPSVKYILE